MFQALEGFIIILAVIFMFGLISFPFGGPKKDRAARIDAAIPSGAMRRTPRPDSSAALEQAASGTRQYVLQPNEQKVTSDAPRYAGRS